ncbi:YggS family pyridoxal phosphate-dependent enzyme [Methanosalsum natronophilum]|uniref:YggS family pyridoxal phosphate-dependent enzyme n=1 Tax=Methanosalsum natronophilum TaxID=768733 RepID=UPI00216792AD|nr:YggS family pyridoxal phosphate-dependent enzyme [Methanosalsum natronophilum]MCS3924088.1 pyridoxal phosphate enzyme (YggS family) [Methanosalsum natronophilum]
MSVAKNLTRVQDEIGNTKLVCVTKTIESPRINEAIQAGASIIGESRVQEYEEKKENILPCEEVHLIGHLQRNKVKKAVQLFDVIQSVDSLKVLRKINKRAYDIDKIQRIYLQINIGDEPQKHGFKLSSINNLFPKIKSFNSVVVEGLMCIPPYLPPEKTRPYFSKMKKLYYDLSVNNQGNIELKELSMGMSNDYPIAIEEGATIVRIGSAIFGKREN